VESGKRSVLKNKKLELDIYIPGLKAAIEYNGNYWHSKPDSIKRDAEKRQQAEQAGIRLLVVTEDASLEEIFAVVKKFLFDCAATI
jgi:hypothetical protein